MLLKRTQITSPTSGAKVTCCGTQQWRPPWGTWPPSLTTRTTSPAWPAGSRSSLRLTVPGILKGQYGMISHHQATSGRNLKDMHIINDYIAHNTSLLDNLSLIQLTK